jgi:hypothetical protein
VTGCTLSKAVIAAHHHERVDVCWACGRDSNHLERCHIIAQQFGGSDTNPANFVLLCHRCHLDAPDVTDGDEMWRWIGQRPLLVKIILNDIFDAVRAHPGALEAPDLVESLLKLLIEYNAGIHAGVSDSTRRWVIHTAIGRTAAFVAAREKERGT